MDTGPTILLNSGHIIPLVGLGTDKIYDQKSMDTAIKAALNTGYRHFDTAKVYGNEDLIGNALEKYLPKCKLNRGNVFLTTKVLPFLDSRVMDFVMDSLDKLKTTYLDLVLIHYPKSNEFENEAIENKLARRNTYLILKGLQEKGIIRSVGVSNYEINHIEEIKEYSPTPPSVNQIEFHPHFRRNELVAYCKKEGIHVIAFSSLGRQNPDLINDRLVHEICQRHDILVSDVLLGFALCQGIGIVPKSCSEFRIKRNFEALNVKLAQNDLDVLNSIKQNKNYIARCTGWLVL